MAWDSRFDADLSLGPALQTQFTAPCHPSRDRSPNLNSDDVPSIGAFLVCYQGLIAVGKEASAVQIIRFTL